MEKMQSLSMWPSKVDFRVVPKLDMEVSQVGSSWFLRTSKIRRKRWDFGDYGCQCRRAGLLSVSSCVRGRKSGFCLGSSLLDIKSGVFDGCSRFQVYFFSKPKEGCVRMAMALALIHEGQTIGNELVGENSVSLDGVSGKNGNCDNVDENGSENEELDRSDEEKGSESKKVREEKKKERIDVRLLGGSLRLARTVEDVEEVLKDKGELPLDVYSTIIKAFGKEKRLEAAMALVQWLKEKKKHSKSSSGPTSFIIYNKLLGAMKECEQFEEVENVVNEMATEGVIPNVVTYNILMGISIEQGKGAEALNLFEEMQKKGLSPDPANCSTALVAYQRMEDGFGALKFYVELREKYRNGFIRKDHYDWETEFSKFEDFTVRLCYQVMRGWLAKNENLNTSVLELLMEMDRVGLGLPTGRSEYKRLMRACNREEHYIVAKELYRRIRERDSKISLSVYNHVIWLMGKAKEWRAALEIYEDLLDKGVIPNVATYDILMGISIGQGKGAEALNLFEEMQKKGLSPSPVNCFTALVAYRRMEDGFGALKFYVELREKYQNGFIGKDHYDWETEFSKFEDFTVRLCYQVMRGWLAKNENLNTSVLELLIEMDRVGLGLPTGRSEYERLMRACTREEHYIVAKELYRRIRERNFEISLSVCNHVIWLMGKANEWWAALEIYEDLLDKGPEPNCMSNDLVVSHFNILLTATRKRGLWEWSVRLLNKMEEKGQKPGSKVWNAVLVACSNASETSAAIQIFIKMVEQGEKPTVVSYCELLSALEKGQRYVEAQQVWENMIRVGVERNVYAYTIMASIYTAQGEINIVDSIIRNMSLSGIEITVVTYNAIISACARNNMSGTAYEWFHKMKAQSISPNEATYEMLIENLTTDGKPKLAYDLYLGARNEGLNLSSKAYDSVIHSAEIYGATIDVDILGPRPLEKKNSVPSRNNFVRIL